MGNCLLYQFSIVCQPNFGYCTNDLHKNLSHKAAIKKCCIDEQRMLVTVTVNVTVTALVVLAKAVVV